MSITPTTASVLKRDNFAQLLTPIHKKVFFESYNEKEKTYPKTFDVEDMIMKQQTYPHMGSFGKWNENEEGNKFNHSVMSEGNVATFTAKRFDKAYEVTWELAQDDQYNVFHGKGKGGNAKGLARGLNATEESAAAAIIKNGFTASNKGYDNVCLFSASHPLANSTSTGDNLITGELTDANLKAALTKMRAQVDEAGTFIAAHAKKLVVHPDWEFAARAIVNSTLQAGTNNNDTNTLPSLNIIVWDYLAADSSDTTAVKSYKPWYIQDDSIDNLKFLWREKPLFDSEKIQDMMDYRFYGYCRFDCGYVDWRGLVGSTGVAPSN